MRIKNILSFVILLISIVAIALFVPKLCSGIDINDENVLGNSLNLYTLLPIVVAVFFAFVTSDVVLSLFIGCILAAFTYISAMTGRIGIFDVFDEFVNATLLVIGNIENLAVLVLCFTMGGLVNLINNIKGLEVLANKVTKKIDTVRKASIITEILGMVCFFDDYANAMIIGPVMQPITDKVKMSREKLAYLVDSTSAPVTGIAIISSWVAVEISVIEEGIVNTGLNASAYNLFLSSIPYCFYCIFCLIIMFLLSIFRRDYGPMLKSEMRARQGEVKKKYDEREKKIKKVIRKSFDDSNDKSNIRLFLTIFSIVFLIVSSFILIYINGLNNLISSGTTLENGLKGVVYAFGASNTIIMVTEATMMSGILLILLSSIFKLHTLKENIALYLDGFSTMVATVVVLVLAWTLAKETNKLGIVQYVVGIISLGVPKILVPCTIFISCCIISFASGSFGTMVVVMPIAIPVAINVSSDNVFLLICIASVLSGSIFGDHCSPITDCTIMSSMSCGCKNIDHVITQMPYAITVGVLTCILDIVFVLFNINVFVILIIGIVILIMIVLLVGKNPEEELKKQGIEIKN